MASSQKPLEDRLIKADLAQIVYDIHGGISFREAQEIVDSILRIMKEGMIRGDKVKLTGFGTFTVIDRKSRYGRNPQTGERILLPGSRYVTFRPSRLIDL